LAYSCRRQAVELIGCPELKTAGQGDEQGLIPSDGVY